MRHHFLTMHQYRLCNIDDHILMEDVSTSIMAYVIREDRLGGAHAGYIVVFRYL